MLSHLQGKLCIAETKNWYMDKLNIEPQTLSNSYRVIAKTSMESYRRGLVSKSSIYVIVLHG